MKTIMTSLPVYDKLIKQTYYRAKADEKGLMATIKTPPWRLPSMQWNVESDNPGTIATITLIDKEGEIYNTPSRCDAWINGDINGNAPFESFTSTGLDIISAVNNAGDAGFATATAYQDLLTGDVIRIKGTLLVNSGLTPKITIWESAASYTYNLIVGENDFTHTITSDGDYYIYIWCNVGASNFSFYDVEINIESFNSYFQTIPELITGLSDQYFQYSGDTLNFLMPYGIYYLKFTTINGFEYYSDMFEVKCIYSSLISAFTNVNYTTFNINSTILRNVAINGSSACYLYSNSFSVSKNEIIRVIFNCEYLSTNDYPILELRKTSDHTTIRSNSYTIESTGIKDINLTCTEADDVELVFYNKLGDVVEYSTSQIYVIRSYSNTHIKIDFSNTCDIGDILYQNGFTQTLWIESEPMEATFPIDDKGVEDGEGRFIRTFARQVKKYSVKTLELPDFMVDVFHRMRLHDDVELTDLVGDTNEVYNLEVEHEWLWDDKYYAQITLTFDYNEAFVVAGCCNNIN